METQLSTQSPFNKLALVVVVEKKHVKIDTNFLFSCPVLRDFSILFQIIFPGLYVTQIFYPLKIFISLYFPEKTNLVSTQPIFFIFLHKSKYLRLEFVWKKQTIIRPTKFLILSLKYQFSRLFEGKDNLYFKEKTLFNVFIRWDISPWW